MLIYCNKNENHTTELLHLLLQCRIEMSIFRQMFVLSHFNRLKVHLSDQLCTLVMISADPKPIMITPHNGAELFQKLHLQFSFFIIFNYVFQDIRSNTNLWILHLLSWIYFTQKTICNSLKKKSILYTAGQRLDFITDP